MLTSQVGAPLKAGKAQSLKYAQSGFKQIIKVFRNQESKSAPCDCRLKQIASVREGQFLQFKKPLNIFVITYQVQKPSRRTTQG